MELGLFLFATRSDYDLERGILGLFLLPELSIKRKTILLTAPLSELYQRLLGTNNRPLLKNGNIKKTLERLWLERKSKYIDMADLTINTSNRSPKDISIEIVESI